MHFNRHIPPVIPEDDESEDEDEDDIYDWFLFEHALAALRTEEEREALRTASLLIQRAHAAGIISKAPWQRGIFGAALVSPTLAPPTAATAATTATASGARGGSKDAGPTAAVSDAMSAVARATAAT